MSQFTLQSNMEADTRNQTRNGYFILGTLMVAALITGALFAYIGYANNAPQLYIITGILTANILIDIWLLAAIRKGNTAFAMGVVIVLFLIDVLPVPFFVKNIGLTIAIAVTAVTLIISGLTLPRKYVPMSIVGGFLAGVLLILLDLQLGADRLEIPLLQTYTPYIVSGIILLLLLIVAQEFKHFSLRVKIAFAILATGAFATWALATFGLTRAEILIDTLSNKFESGIFKQIETGVSAAAQTESQNADELFANTLVNLQALAKYQENLLNRSALFEQGAYWNAASKIYTLPNGQYTNPASDPASVFISNIYPLNDDMLAELNTTAYLDLMALNFLKANPRLSAVYFISNLGMTTYYPNIQLAEKVPADFDPRRQVFFTIAESKNNPARQPQWTTPYQDPAGSGLIVTLSIPVYSNDKFKGVLAADLNTAQVLEAVSNIQVGGNGFAMLTDNEGRILAMPQSGYDFLQLQPEIIPINESPTQSIVNIGNAEIKSVLQNALQSESGLSEVQARDSVYYVVFSSLKATGYRLIFITPKEETTAIVKETQLSIEEEKRNLAQSVSLLLFGFFVAASIVSLIVGQAITNPLVQLTKTVEQITQGDLSARAIVDSRDEAGRLAASVNIMSDELRAILDKLEERVQDRTRELEKINELNIRRAAQFETISRIARAISATQSLETLLPQVVDTISKQFDFYHVGIFLIDNRHEYAILVAANSEGGKKMLARNHRLLVGESGIVGYVTSVGQPRVALDVGSDSVYFSNPDLPNTHSEIALPLKIGADIFGALDVQSTEENAFSQEDINILSTLADQVSIAIQNARSYQQSREALTRAEKISAQLSGQQWKRFVEQQSINGYIFDGIGTKAMTPEAKQRAYQLTIPLVLRGTRIGAIKIHPTDPDREWTDDELSMVQAAADRASLALENARLLEESQKRAAKEHTIGEISAKIGSVTDLESIIQTALQELGNTLPGMDIALQFKED